MGFADVIFELDDGTEVYAHKLLCVRAEYFKAMFCNEWAEKEKRRIPVKDVASHVFLQLLTYLYTDNVKISLGIAMDLFVAADHFGVERLKCLCEKKILISINTDNAATVLVAANLHNAFSLRQSCLDFILLHFDTVSKTPAFEEMGRTNVELVFEVLKRR